MPRIYHCRHVPTDSDFGALIIAVSSLDARRFYAELRGHGMKFGECIARYVATADPSIDPATLPRLA